MDRRQLTKDEITRAGEVAIPIGSLAVARTHRGRPPRPDPLPAVLIFRPRQNGDLVAFSGHHRDLIESLRRAADALERLYP